MLLSSHACIFHASSLCPVPEGWLWMASLGRSGSAAPGQWLSCVTGLPCPGWTDWDAGLPKPPGLPSPAAGLAVSASTHTCVSISVLKDTTLQRQCLVFYNKTEAPYTQSLSHVRVLCTLACQFYWKNIKPLDSFLLRSHRDNLFWKGLSSLDGFPCSYNCFPTCSFLLNMSAGLHLFLIFVRVKHTLWSRVDFVKTVSGNM